MANIFTCSADMVVKVLVLLYGMMTSIKTFICTLGIVLILSSQNRINATMKTPAQLLNELRSSQINAMIAEQNKMAALMYSDQLATADFEDMQKRLLRADSDIFEINATPYSPFKVKKTPKNLGYLGRGYDALYGNPLDESGRVDPGFRVPVVDLEYLQNRFSVDGEYRIPDNADVIMEPSALFSSSFNDVRTLSDYKHQLKDDVKTTAGLGLSGSSFSMSGEFSQSTSYQSNKERIEKGGNVNIDIIGRATAYKARLHTLGDMYASQELQKDIQDLPAKCSDPKTGLSAYYSLIRKFGTHFTTVVTMGAKAVQRVTMTSSESMELKQQGISTSQVVSATVGFAAKGVSASLKLGQEESSTSDTKITNILQTMDIKKSEFYVGGEPPSLPYTQRFYYSIKFDGEQNDDPGIGSTESLREWGRSAHKRPVPIQYELQAVLELFDKTHLPNVSDDKNIISGKQACMKKALQGYCSKEAVDSLECSPNGDSKELNAIRYGDLIAIQKVSNKGTTEYLNVPENDPKFVSGNKAENMKVVPVDPKAFWKYGTALHYEEPFNLISEYGGQQKIVSCGFGTRENYVLFNSGNKKITCEAKALPIGSWTAVYETWCNKNIRNLLPNKMSLRECAKDCIDKLQDECIGVQYLANEKCAHCRTTDKVEPFTDIMQTGVRPVTFHNRVDKDRKLPYPKLPTTLYFASPEGKKSYDVVAKNDKVYIGITSFEERKPLFDVRRPAFLKAAQKEAQVHVDEGNQITDLNVLKSCTNNPKKTQLECPFWWKVLVVKKTLHTYPNAHYE